MSDPARVRYLIQHYPQLQGLRLVPLGLVFVAIALWHDGQLAWLPGTDEGGIRFWLLGALAIAVVVSYAIGAYYRRLFGTLTFAPFQSGGPRIAAIGAVLFGSFVLQDTFRWSLSLPLVVVGIVLAYIGVTQRLMRGHYIGIAVACLVMANIDAFGVPARTQRIMLDLLIAGGLLVGGIGDHLVLMRSLYPRHRPGYAQTPV